MKVLSWAFNHMMLIGALFFFIQLQFFSEELADLIVHYILFLFFALAALIETVNNKLDKLMEKFKDGTD